MRHGYHGARALPTLTADADGRRRAGPPPIVIIVVDSRELRGGEDDESVWRWDGFWDNESLVCPSGVRRQGEAKSKRLFRLSGVRVSGRAAGRRR